MSKTEENELIQRAIRQLGIDVPVLATRVVGNRLELYLYGGRVEVYQYAQAEASHKARTGSQKGRVKK